MGLGIRQLHPLFVGEIGGVDVGHPLDAADVRALDEAIDHPIVCLPTYVGAGNPPRYPPITYGEYRVWWLNTNYGAKLAEEKALLQRTQRMC